jgi:hypothetical protein
MESLTSFYEGKTLAEARNLATAAGFQVCVEIEGMQQLNCEYRAGRITFTVQNVGTEDRVVGVRIG